VAFKFLIFSRTPVKSSIVRIVLCLVSPRYSLRFEAYLSEAKFLQFLLSANTDAECFNDTHEFLAYLTSMYRRLFFSLLSEQLSIKLSTSSGVVKGPPNVFKYSRSLYFIDSI
ncbi:unnamed protein product, partial [Meganyctiphanes norvegica]